jgi:hypothetical protein
MDDGRTLLEEMAGGCVSAGGTISNESYAPSTISAAQADSTLNGVSLSNVSFPTAIHDDMRLSRQERRSTHERTDFDIVLADLLDHLDDFRIVLLNRRQFLFLFLLALLLLLFGFLGRRPHIHRDADAFLFALLLGFVLPATRTESKRRSAANETTRKTKKGMHRVEHTVVSASSNDVSSSL